MAKHLPAANGLGGMGNLTTFAGLPAVNAPLPGGMSYQLVIDLIHGLTKKADVQSFDLVEFLPQKDIHGLGALTAARITFNMIGALVRSR